jgi:hypothetical protein
MVGIFSLWLPIVLSAVLVFLVSSVVHMVLRYHRNDYSQASGEANLLEAMRKEGIAPGNYYFPHCASMKEMGSPEMKKKFEQGPVGFLTVLPSGPLKMGKQLTLWFVFSVLVSVVVAYLTGRTVAADAAYLQVFRVAGTVAFVAYAGAEPAMSIWKGQKWSTTAKTMFDGLLYSLVTAGAFAGFWPN